MSIEVEFSNNKLRAWEKIERLIDKELESESSQYQDQIKSIMASTLKENEELFVDDLPYLLALVKDGDLASLQNHTDSEAVVKVQKLVDILGPKMKAIMDEV